MAKAEPKKSQKPTDSPIEDEPAAAKLGVPTLMKAWAGKLKPTKDKKSLTFMGIVAAALVGLVIVVFGLLIYHYKSTSPVVTAAAKVIPYPVERVGSSFVSYAQYLFEVNSIKHYYQNQPGPDGKPTIDFNTADGKTKLKEIQNQVLGQLKEEAVTKQQIAKYRVTVSKKELDDQLKQISQQAGGDDKVKEVLTKYYGWTYEDFKTKVRFQIAKQKLQEKIAADENLNKQAKSAAEEVLKQVKGGKDFTELAKEKSQDPGSASSGGDLGFFPKAPAEGAMVKEFEDVAFALQPGQISDLVKTKFGYHIIKVIEKKDDTVHAAHILIKSIDFETYIKDLVAKAKTTTYLKV